MRKPVAHVNKIDPILPSQSQVSLRTHKSILDKVDGNSLKSQLGAQQPLQMSADCCNLSLRAH